METNEVVTKHAQRLKRTRLLLNSLILIIFITIVIIQWQNILRLFKWVWTNI